MGLFDKKKKKTNEELEYEKLLEFYNQNKDKVVSGNTNSQNTEETFFNVFEDDLKTDNNTINNGFSGNQNKINNFEEAPQISYDGFEFDEDIEVKSYAADDIPRQENVSIESIDFFEEEAKNNKKEEFQPTTKKGKKGKTPKGQKKKKKVWLIVLIVILSILLLGVIGFFGYKFITKGNETKFDKIVAVNETFKNENLECKITNLAVSNKILNTEAPSGKVYICVAFEYKNIGTETLSWEKLPYLNLGIYPGDETNKKAKEVISNEYFKKDVLIDYALLIGSEIAIGPEELGPGEVREDCDVFLVDEKIFDDGTIFAKIDVFKVGIKIPKDLNMLPKEYGDPYAQ